MSLSLAHTRLRGGATRDGPRSGGREEPRGRGVGTGTQTALSALVPLMPHPLPLLAVPNLSEGRDQTAIEAIAAAFTVGGHTRLLDLHADPDHHRAVLTLAGAPGTLAEALVAGVGDAVRRIDLLGGPPSERGEHPCVGAVDVLPVVYLEGAQRGAACAEALVAADRIGRGAPGLRSSSTGSSPPPRGHRGARARSCAAADARAWPSGWPQAGSAPISAPPCCTPRRGRRWWRRESHWWPSTWCWRRPPRSRTPARSPVGSARGERRVCRGCERSACRCARARSLRSR